jgi:MoaA/NifB/PqqE/SkfB family radical SAM enzyme
LARLPLLTLYLTERCNSRCVTCDYWRQGKETLSLNALRKLLPELKALKTRVVVLSGGEPLMHAQWRDIARELRTNGQQVWLLTSGLALAKHAGEIAGLFDALTVSLDGTDATTYERIRGLNAFEKVCEGIRAAAAVGLAPALRITLQAANLGQLHQFVSLAESLGASQVSFLTVDLANAHAFGRVQAADRALAPSLADIARMRADIETLSRSHAEYFASGFIAESPEKLARMAQYFEALHGAAPYPKVRCNAPQFSAVVGASGGVQPCFFIAGPSQARVSPQTSLSDALNEPGMTALRANIGSGSRPECKTCVCSMWRPL